MSILLAFAGFVIAVLFAAAGYRATNDVRFQDMRDKITYHGRLQAFYESLRKADLLVTASLLKRAAMAKSTPCRSRC